MIVSSKNTPKLVIMNWDEDCVIGASPIKTFHVWYEYKETKQLNIKGGFGANIEISETPGDMKTPVLDLITFAVLQASC